VQTPLVYGGRRRRRLRPLALGALAAAFIGGTIGVWQIWPDGGGAAAATGIQPAAKAAIPRSAPVAAWVASKLAAPSYPQDLVVVRRPPARGALTHPISARGAILVDASNGTVVWARHEHVRLPMASVTKIMTAAIALEHLGPNDVVTVDPLASRAAPFREGLRPHEKVLAWKLFYGLLLYSGNDDAVALAIASSGSRTAFLHEMNDRARDLGLRNTHFTSPSGLVDKGNFSTAWDMAAITRHALQNPRFRRVVGTRVKRVSWAAPTYSKIYVNKNHLLGAYPGAYGVKTGWTTIAKHTLVAAARRNGVDLIAVVLGSDDSYADVRQLLDYGFRHRG
jgi:D-alanyl-D-alanine carboxypeptidase